MDSAKQIALKKLLASREVTRIKLMELEKSAKREIKSAKKRLQAAKEKLAECAAEKRNPQGYAAYLRQLENALDFHERKVCEIKSQIEGVLARHTVDALAEKERQAELNRISAENNLATARKTLADSREAQKLLAKLAGLKDMFE